jgi:hypothetical protein
LILEQSSPVKPSLQSHFPVNLTQVPFSEHLLLLHLSITVKQSSPVKPTLQSHFPVELLQVPFPEHFYTKEYNYFCFDGTHLY